MKLIMLKWIPACGKTTWAKQQSAKRVNKDDLRAMIDNSKWSKSNEKKILLVRDSIVRTYLSEWFDVIVDDTNIVKKHEVALRSIADEFNAHFEVKEFDTPLWECIERDKHRDKSVWEDVIIRMRQQMNGITAPEINPARSSCIICDIDWTLAHMNGRHPYEWDRVWEDILDRQIELILNLYRNIPDKHIFLVSGRDWSCKKQTIEWLEKNDIEYTDLFMRKPWDKRKDFEVKLEIYEQEIKDQFNVDFVLDDRDQVVALWRWLGLKCLQVWYGNF